MSHGQTYDLGPVISLDLPESLPQKNVIFHWSDNANFVKNVATNPEFQQFRQISSKINTFVTMASFSSFRQFFVKMKSFRA